MKTTYLLSKSLYSDTFNHLICTNPISIYSLPECVCISGVNEPELKAKALKWFKSHYENEIQIPRLLPSGYKEAIQKVRDNIEQIDIQLLAANVGVRELDIARIIDGFHFEGKPYHFTYRTRVKFKDEVDKLLL